MHRPAVCAVSLLVLGALIPRPAAAQNSPAHEAAVQDSTDLLFSVAGLAGPEAVRYVRAWDPTTGEIRDVATLEGGRFDGIEIVGDGVLIASRDECRISP